MNTANNALRSVREKQRKIGMVTVLTLTAYLATGCRYTLVLSLLGIAIYLLLGLLIWICPLLDA